DGVCLVAGINGQAGVQANDITSRAVDIVQGVEHHGRGFSAVTDFDGPIRHHGHAIVFGVDLVFAYFPVFQFTHQRGGAQRRFVHAVFAVHDEHVVGTQTLEYAHLYADQIGVKDTHELIG